MSDDILVIDDCLPPKTYDELAQFIAQEPMEYGARSNSRTDPHGHWSRKFAPGGPFNLADISNALDADPRLAPINATWKHIRDTQLEDRILIRCYLNGYTYGVDGYFHRDSRRADEHTAIVYMNDQWEPDWAGETVFLADDGDIARSVLPHRNRAVIFPASMQHAGRSVSRKCTALRRTLIYKTRKQRSEDFERLSVFLREAGGLQIGHRRGSLHDHLVRTFSILESRGCRPGVCFGGGLHSVYGTNAFRRTLLSPDDKQSIVGAFGAEAEHFAYLFSILDRPTTLAIPLSEQGDFVLVQRNDRQTLSLPRTIFDDLRKIECANLQDQNSLESYPALSGLWESMKGGTPF
jgi:SM-20-related protein